MMKKILSIQLLKIFFKNTERYFNKNTEEGVINEKILSDAELKNFNTRYPIGTLMKI
jgi:hypothetical protein